MTPLNGEDETGALALRVIALEAALENLQTESASDEPTVIPANVPDGSPDARVKPAPWIVVGRASKSASDISEVYVFEAHYADEYFNDTTSDFYTEQGFLNCFLDIALDLRLCDYSVGLDVVGDHPGFTKPKFSGAPFIGVAWGNLINTWDGDDDTWLDLGYSATAADAGGTDLGHGVEAITGLKIQCQIKTTGELNLRLYDHTNSSIHFSLAGALRRVVHPRLEVGTQIEFGRNTCHEKPVEPDTWGDGLWTPGE